SIRYGYIVFCSVIRRLIHSYLFMIDHSHSNTYPLSLHDALPISGRRGFVAAVLWRARSEGEVEEGSAGAQKREGERASGARGSRSEEHTSELQSRFDLVCRLLLEKKKTYK